MDKNILRLYGSFLLLLANFLAVPLIVAIIYDEDDCAEAFIYIILGLGILGFLIRSFVPDEEDAHLRPRFSFFIVSSAWFIASLVGCLPYFISGYIPGFIDAFFETASGFTTTGSTILTDIEALPKSLLFWRSLTQWLGGMGIMVLFVALLPNFGIKGRTIAGETPGPTVTRIAPRFYETARLLYYAYMVLTGILFLLLLPKMGIYDAANHALTTMATGGYSTHNDGISYFNSAYVDWVLIIFMFLAGTNFNLFFYVLGKQPGKMFRDEEFRFYGLSVAVATALIVWTLLRTGTYDRFFPALTDSAFQVITVMTTTGYATADFSLWPAFTQMILVMLMLSGASSSSTAGGIKKIRVLVFFKMIRYEIAHMLHSNIVDEIRYNGKKIMPETLTYIMTFISTYIFTLLTAVLVISATGDGNLVTNFTAVLTCVSNVGPGLDMVGPVCNFSFYSEFSKLILSFAMIAGRLEFSTLLIIFTRFFWRPYKS